MATTTQNWVHDTGTVKEKDRVLLEQVHKKERRDERYGFQWVRIDARTKVHVPCDKNGNPTKDGERRIRKLKDYLNIK